MPGQVHDVCRSRAIRPDRYGLPDKNLGNDFSVFAQNEPIPDVFGKEQDAILTPW